MSSSVQSTGPKTPCQLSACEKIGKEPLPWYLRRQGKLAYRTVINFPRYARRKAGGALRKLRQLLWYAFGEQQEIDARPTVRPQRYSSSEGVSDRLTAGDRVRVRLREEIEKTLDIRRRCKGCPFAEPMFKWCGQELRVLKRVERFFDEKKQRLVTCRNIVLLEGVFCDGSGYPESQGCDRMCYYFWHTDWLERIEDSH